MEQESEQGVVVEVSLTARSISSIVLVILWSIISQSALLGR